MTTVKVKHNADDSKEWFELSGGKVKKANARVGSIFISSSVDSQCVSRTYVLEHNEKARFVYALNEKNARRIFKRQNLL